MIIRRVFDYTHSESEATDGSLGWIMRGMPNFDPVEGTGAAHDCIEHFDLDQSLEAEYMAFGTILWGRGLGGFFSQYSRHSAEENMATDVGRFIIQADCQLLEVDGKWKRMAKLDDDCAEEMVQTILRRGRHYALAELKDRHDSIGQDARWALAEAMKRIGDWIRVGVNRAQRRWGKYYDSYEFSYLFKRVQEEFNCVTLGDAEQGEEIRFRMDTKTGEFKFTRREVWQ